MHQTRRRLSYKFKQSQHVCTICMSDKPNSEDWSVKMTPACDHERTCCDDCIRRHVKEELISKNGFRDVPCLHSSCKATMTFDTLKRCLSVDDLQRYELRLLTRCLESEAKFKWCSGTDCQWGAILEDVEPHQTVFCSSCFSQTALNTNGEWKTESTCNGYYVGFHQSAEEKTNLCYINAKTKPCPSCKHAIEKDGGCDHITCVSCRYVPPQY
ncbi:hypothetical protein P9112_014719 [Eukaryota sp. TZLM1-RC]